MDVKSVWNEIYALGALDHPHVLKLVEVFMDDASVRHGRPSKERKPPYAHRSLMPRMIGTRSTALHNPMAFLFSYDSSMKYNAIQSAKLSLLNWTSCGRTCELENVRRACFCAWLKMPIPRCLALP